MRTCGGHIAAYKFFFDCQYVLQLRRYSLTKLSDGAQMAIFGVQVWQTSTLRRLRLREEKKEEQQTIG